MNNEDGKEIGSNNSPCTHKLLVLEKVQDKISLEMADIIRSYVKGSIEKGDLSGARELISFLPKSYDGELLRVVLNAAIESKPVLPYNPIERAQRIYSALGDFATGLLENDAARKYGALLTISETV
jgi:hypothetical protein